MIRHIVEHGFPGSDILKKPTKRVAHSQDIRQLAIDMVETMKANNGVGLAAPQVGLRYRMFVAEILGKVITVVNPVITSTSIEQDTEYEGCLSLPDVRVPVRRPVKIVLRGLTLERKMFRIEVSGGPARILQHEVDHLDGVLIVDKVDQEWLESKAQDGTVGTENTGSGSTA